MAGKLIILGLRRAGTTIFWETFGQDRRLLGYDEPFNPWLKVLPGSRGLKHPQEFQDLLAETPLDFWMRYSPIVPMDELREGLSDKHREYLSWLLSRGDRVVLDVTRCHFKIEALHELAPDAVLVHLFRPPPSHASSHMLPSDKRRFRSFRRWRDRQDFWTRPDRYDHWSLETIIGRAPGTLFAHRLREIGLDPDAIYRLPAVAKLLAYWRVNFERAERDGRRWYGDRFVSQSFDEFCQEPRPALEKIYDAMDLSMPQLDLSRIHPPNGPHQPDSEQWRHFSELVGLAGS